MEIRLIKNISYSEVLNTVNKLFTDENLKQRNLVNDTTLKEDIICYMLNRIPPCYTASSRGYNYYISGQKTQTQVDLFALFFEALNVFQRKIHDYVKTPQSGHEDETWFNFPLFTGTVYDGETFSKLSNVKITFYLDNQIIHNTKPNYPNPYNTHSKTKGQYTFLLDPVKNDSPDMTERIFYIKIAFEHQDYKEPASIHERLILKPQKIALDTPDEGDVFKLPDAYL